VKYLLDTHVFLWYTDGSQKLSEAAENLIDNPNNVIYFSIASLWEIAIKIGIGRLDLSFNSLISRLENSGFFVLQPQSSHLGGIINLPPIHKDPFDRLLIATALAENMTILTADENIHKYDVNWIW
jgi:PIN domain nuclease of toxin-antitoxin system